MTATPIELSESTADTDLLLDIHDLTVGFPTDDGLVKAVRGVSYQLRAGESLGIVGESGSGKTTLGKTMLRLYQPQAGTIRYAGTDITRLGDGALRPFRRDLQMIFQDPLSSFNPRVTIAKALALPLRLHRLCVRAEQIGRAHV